MSDLKTDPTTAVLAQDPTEAADFNQLRTFARFWAENEDDPSVTEDEAVVVSKLFSQHIQNVRPEALGTNQIRVPFTADRPPSLIIDGHMIQATGNIDSATITGGAGTRYIIANRSTKTFTITISTSATVGDDQRVVGNFEWSGTAIVDESVESYELSGSGALTSSDDQIIKSYGKILSAGSVSDSFGLASASQITTGEYLLTFTRQMDNTNYVILAMTNTQQYICFSRSSGLTTVEIHITNTAGTKVDSNFFFIMIGEL